MTDWIKHTPGDPMPVDGDTVVDYMMRNGETDDGEIAGSLRWSCANTPCDITAYRIHKKEREMKYKAGTITLNISQSDADILNCGNSIIACGSQIIAHQPAPEPMEAYINVSMDTFGWTYPRTHGTWSNGLPTIKLTYFPATKEVKAEIVG